MRKSKFTLLAALALSAVAFTSCDKNEPETPDYDLHIIGFEDAALPADGYELKDDSAYSEKGLDFSYSYSEDSYEWEGETISYVSWDGFAVSELTDKTTPGKKNEFSVYNTGGAGGSSQFAVVFYSSWSGPAECSFAAGEEREIEYAYITNSTYAYLAVKDGNDDYGAVTAFADGDWFKLTITGYGANGNKTSAIDFYLADYRNGKSIVISDWTKVVLTSLGKVNKVTFELSSTDNSEYNGEESMNTPSYFCIDNIAYREYVTE